MSKDSVLDDLKNLKSKNNDLKWTAINHLSKYLQSNPTDFRSRMIIKSLMPFTKDPDDKIRETVLTTLFNTISEPESLEPHIFSALSDKSPGIRSLALEWLSNQKHRALKSQAIKALEDPGEIVRKTALEIVVAHQIEGVEPQLLGLLKTESGGLRRRVIYALGKLKTPQAIGTLVEIMRNPDYDDWTRNQASSALDHMGGRELVIPFIENLTDPNDYVRETAAAYLKKNEDEIVSVVMSSGKIDLIAFLQNATDTTKQDFAPIVATLTSRMSFAIEDLQSRLMNKDQLSISDLAADLQSSEVATKILTEKILSLKLFPLDEDTFITETGLERLLTTMLRDNLSIHISTLKQENPFKKIPSENLEEIISSIPISQRVSKELFLTKEVYSKIASDLENKGLLKLPEIANNINISIDLIKNTLIPALKPQDEGWYNFQNEYITRRFLQMEINKQLSQYYIISLDNFLNQIGNPKIEQMLLKEMIEEQFQGKWLDDINVFLESSEFQKLERDSSGIDESRVNHLLTPITLDFPQFLRSLQKILDIKTFETSDGQLISLDHLHPLLQQNIIGQGFLSIPEFLKKSKLDRFADSIKPVILNYITQEFSGSTTPDMNYFFTEDLISKVAMEVEAQTRINFSVLAFKLDLVPEILAVIVKQVLFVRGFTNTIGEFITEKGINQEIKGILEFRQEFTLQELLEILEIVKDKKNEKIVRDLISEDSDLLISDDKNIIITQKAALNKVIYYIQQPTQRMKELVPWEEIRRKTNISKIDIRIILDSLIQNNLLSGAIQEQGYRP